MDKTKAVQYSSKGLQDPGEVSPAEEGPSRTEGVVWRKLDIRILPLCTCFFLLAVLDRTNIGNARVAGLQKSLAISNYQYTVALTVTYLPYVFISLPSTLLLKYVGADLMLPATVSLWGVAAATQGLVDNYSKLLICRVFLGTLEGGIFPGIIIYLSYFYPRKWLQVRITVFYVASSLASAFSGLLAAAIDQVDGKGGKHGWAWIFILEGIFTFVFGVISFCLLPRSPETACFLNEKERAHVVSTLKRVGSISEEDSRDKFSWIEVGRTAKSPHVWLLAITAFLNGAIVIGLALFAPSIIVGLGYRGNYAQLMSVPPFAVAFVLSLISAILSDRYQCRGCVVIVCSLLEVIGFTMFYASTSNHVRYGSLFFSIPGTYSTASATITWLANNSAPYVRRATAVAVGSTLAQVGGILVTWLLGSWSPAPNYTAAAITFIVMSACLVVLSTANLIYLWKENRAKAEKRQRMSKEEEPEGLGDRSAWFIYSL